MIDGSGGDQTQGIEPVGGGTDPNADPHGGDQTHGDPSAAERWDDASFRAERLNAMHKTGYGKGRSKGQQEAISALLKSLGMSSVEDLKARLEPDEEPETTPAPQATQMATQAPSPEVESKAMREARLARMKLERELSERQQAMTQLEARAARALRGELRSRLVQSGAHEGVDDLVTALVDVEHRFGWAKDGQDIVAFDKMDDGTLDESAQSIDEVIAEIVKKRPWFFRGEPKQGSGYQGNPRPQPRQPSNGWSFDDNIARYANRKQSR